MSRQTVSAVFVLSCLLPHNVDAALTVEIESQTVSVSGNSTVEIKVIAESTTTLSSVTSLSMKGDIGIDFSQPVGSAARYTPNSLPAGFSFPTTIVDGGKVAESGWGISVDASPAAAELADFIVTANQPLSFPPAAGIDLSSGPVHLFSIFLTADATAVGETFIDLATSGSNAFSPTEIPEPTYTPGSITVQATAVPEPGAFALLGMIAPVLTVLRKLQRLGE